MRRRDALRSGLALACTASLGGCLGALDSDSAWRDLVVDRPDGVYVPPKIDGMVPLGTARGDGYVLALSATRPHRFWTVTGTETNQIALREAHSIHLMATVREATTGRYLPAAVVVSLSRGDEHLLARTLWPMLSQRMGPHHGDNVALPGSGTYTADVRVLPADVRHRGSPTDEVASGVHEIGFEYDPATIDALDRTILPEERRGEPGAVAPMDHGHAQREANGGDRPPVPIAPTTEAFPDPIGTGHASDCPIVVARADRPADSYLIASMRTPHNRFPVALTSLSARIDHGGSTERVVLESGLDPEFGHHYGARVDPLERGDEITVAVETPPQMARQEGYETAFLDRGRFSLRVPRST